MGEVLRIPKERTRLRRKPYWRVVDLLGQPPKGHKAPTYGPRGRVLMAPGQVWVEGHNQRLWVIKSMTLNKKRKGSLYPNDVVLRAYRGRQLRALAETGVRMGMQVWEVYLVSRKELMEKLAYLSERDPGSPFKGRPQAALNFFGFDVQGNRID